MTGWILKRTSVLVDERGALESAVSRAVMMCLPFA
jgi:hypothetical protein